MLLISLFFLFIKSFATFSKSFLPPSFPSSASLYRQGQCCCSWATTSWCCFRGVWLAFSEEEREGEGTAGFVCPVQSVLPPPAPLLPLLLLLLLHSCCYCRPANTAFLGQQADDPEAGESVETQPSPSQHSSAQLSAAQLSHHKRQGRGDTSAHSQHRNAHTQSHTQTLLLSLPLSLSFSLWCSAPHSSSTHSLLIHSLTRLPLFCQSLCLAALCLPAWEWSSRCLGVCCRGLSEHTQKHTKSINTRKHTHTNWRAMWEVRAWFITLLLVSLVYLDLSSWLCCSLYFLK